MAKKKDDSLLITGIFMSGFVAFMVWSKYMVPKPVAQP